MTSKHTSRKKNVGGEKLEVSYLGHSGFSERGRASGCCLAMGLSLSSCLASGNQELNVRHLHYKKKEKKKSGTLPYRKSNTLVRLY